MLDLIIRNVQITDGSGGASYIGDVGAVDGKIVMSPQGEAREEIDGTGKVLCPGFIDSHSHMDRMLGSLDELAQLARLSQGVTTEVTAQCGVSIFPNMMTGHRRAHLFTAPTPLRFVDPSKPSFILKHQSHSFVLVN